MQAAPRLLSLATATPSHLIRQEEIVRLSERAFDRSRSEIERLMPVFANAGIQTRYFCMPIEWYLEPHGWIERSRLYVDHAVDLAVDVARRCLEQARCSVDDIDGIVTVSTTGIATPSLDALVMERLAMRRDVRRLPLFGLGCAGGVIGLSRAAEMAMARPGSRILVLVVELCSLTFRYGDNSKSNIVAAALFGDGAAALLLDGAGGGPILGDGGEHTWPDSLDVMGWHIEEDGFGVLFSRDIPSLVRREFRPVVDDFLACRQLRLKDLAGFVCHPGGAKVMDALEDAFGLTLGSMRTARDVLREFGNMSAATVLFVLQRMLPNIRGGRYLMSALGPGFTAGFQLLHVA
ncbi:MAG TPA: type III polyketide synthase [Methylomirabilota bacterium]|nr:type III polyketide synthase [Methylomirabilota bacterium]